MNELSKSIDTYESSSRIAAYDEAMQIMHPNRRKMVKIALDFLPFEPPDRIRLLDLGVGTGLVTEAMLRRFPRCSVVAVDGAGKMLEAAHARLGSLANRVEFRKTTIERVKAALADCSPFDAVVSSFALHHLAPASKRRAIESCVGLLCKAGWFLNADLVVAEAPSAEARIQRLRVEGVLRRSGGESPFSTADAIREYLNDLERADGDQPLTLTEDLDLLSRAGIRKPLVLWKEYREVVYGGAAD